MQQPQPLITGNNNNINNHPANVGGPVNGPAAPKRTSQDVIQELDSLKQRLDTEINTLPPSRAAQGQPPTLGSPEALQAKIQKAFEAQAKLSHATLLKEMKTQHENLQKDLELEANIRDDNNKKSFNAAVNAYLSKRLELARVRLEEIAHKNKRAINAQKHVQQQFRTPTGTTGPEVIEKLGDTHNHIVPNSGKEKEIVKYENGVMTSRSPHHLAITAKSKGMQSFKFTVGKATYGGANNLIQSVEEMLRVGIKHVEIDDKLMQRMLANPPAQGHSSGDYAAQLAKFIGSGFDLNVGTLQKRKLKQLDRICKTSTAVYKNRKSNPVFGADGKLKPDNEESKLAHQADTFMALDNKADRKAYLKLLFPKNTERYYAAFTKELESRHGTIAVGTKTYTPKEYFEKELLWRWSPLGVSRSQYQSKVNLVNEVETFKDPNTSDAARKELYSKTTDEKSLRQMAKSDHLNDNQKRKDFVNAVFDAANKVKPDNTHEVGLRTRPILASNYVSTDDKKAFVKKTLPLFAKISVTNPANNNQVNLDATLQEKSTLLTDLRNKAEQTYASEKAAAPNSPAPFNNYLKNKILIDELETQMIQNHAQQVLQDLMIRTKNQLTPADQANALNDTQTKHLQTYTNIGNTTQKVEHFVNQLSPDSQVREWKSLNNADPNTLEFRALVLKQLMDQHNEAHSPAATEHLKTTAKSLLAQLDDAQKTAVMKRVGELCLNSPNTKILGTNRNQNRALHTLRGLVPTPAAKPLLSTELFKKYFEASPTPAEKTAKLIERVQCYASEVSANFVENFRLKRKFEAEMSELLYPNNAANPQSEDLVASVQQTLGVIAMPDSQAKNIKTFVESLKTLNPNHAKAAGQQQRFNTADLDSDLELDSEIFDTVDSQSVEDGSPTVHTI